jgi:hypothetical protein
MERYYYAVVPEGGPDAASSPGMTLVATFPFWMFVDRFARLDEAVIDIDGASVRVYPPFRTAAANYLPLPEVSPGSIPFLSNAEARYGEEVHVPSMAVMPNLETGREVLTWGAKWDDNLRYLPMDSVRLDVFPADAGPTTATIQRRLIAALRHRTRQWWIGRSLVGVIDTTRVSFFVETDGSPLGAPQMRGSVSKLFGDEQAIDADLWKVVLADVKHAYQHPVSTDLLLDARYFAVGVDYRRALLEAAIACEFEVKATFTRLLNAKGVRFSEGKHLRGSDLEQWVDTDLARISGGRSYRLQPDNQIEWVERLWDVRGRVAHGSSLAYPSGSRMVQVDGDTVLPLLFSAEHLVTWLQSLA